MHDGWALFPFQCVTCKKLQRIYFFKYVTKKKTTLVCKSPHELSLTLAAFSRYIEKHMGVHFLSSTNTRSKNSDGSHK